MKVLVETSARHLHVSPADLETLFGPGYQLTQKKALSQPGQFATNEKVKVVGPRGELNMTILGPTRKSTQVEVSFSDARALGITAPVRESGDTQGSASCKLVAPWSSIWSRVTTVTDCGVSASGVSVLVAVAAFLAR